jgi:hypothetical protein
MFKGESTAEYRIWRRKAKLIYATSNYPKHKFRAFVVSNCLDEAAYDAVEHLDEDDLTQATGFDLVIDALDSNWKDAKEYEMSEEFDKLMYQTRFERGETTAQFVTKKRIKSRLSKMQVTLPSELMGYLLLKAAGLNKEKQATLIGATPSTGMDFDELCSTMLSIWPRSLPTELRRGVAFAAVDEDDEPVISTNEAEDYDLSGMTQHELAHVAAHLAEENLDDALNDDHF